MADRRYIDYQILAAILNRASLRNSPIKELGSQEILALTRYIMEHGQLVECGHHEELLAQQGIYASLWQVQTGLKYSKERQKAKFSW